MKHDSTPQPHDSPFSLHQVYQEAPVGLCAFDTDLRYVYINAWLAALNGIPVEDHLGRTVGEVLPDLVGNIEPQLQKVIDTGQPVVEGTASGSTMAGSGDERHFQHSYQPIMSGDGSVEGVNCVVLDVTERKRADEAHSRLIAIIETTPDFVGYASPDEDVIYVNKAGRAMLGFGLDEDITGLKISDVHPAWAYEIIAREGLPQATRDGVWTGEVAFLHREGHEIPVSMVAAVHKTPRGEVAYLSTISRDITKRKRGERRLRAHHAVTRVLAEATSLSEATPPILHAVCRNLGWACGALWWIDATAHRLRCVETWQRSPDQLNTFVAQTRETTFAREVGLPGRVWASNQPAWIPDVTSDSNFPRASVATQDGLHAAFAFPIRIKGAVEGVMEFFSPQIHQPDDDLLRLVDAVGSQIGQFVERRRAEEALRDAYSEVESRVERRTTELSAVNARLRNEITKRKEAEHRVQASLAEKELLLKEIQHRVKNNLQIINSLLDLQALSIRNKQAKLAFEECQNRIKSMALLYEKLYRSADLGTVQLRDYTQSIIDHLTQFYGPIARRVCIQLHCHDVVVGLDCAIPCGLIINELVSNAMKHAFPNNRHGSVTVTIRPSRGRHLALIVRDDGIGLPDDLDTRLNQTLGLQLTQALAREQLQGRIKSKNTNGTTWTVTFAPTPVKENT